jgi:hypothetical protein
MNQILLATDIDLVTVVFRRLEQHQPAASGAGALRSGALDAFEAAVSEKAQELRELAAQSVREGYEAVQGAVRSFTAGVEEAATRLGKRAQEFRDRLMDFVRNMIRETFDVMLGSLRPTLAIGGVTYRMESINMEQKLVFSGSLDISVTSLVKLLGSGELVLKGTYTAQSAPPP